MRYTAGLTTKISGRTLDVSIPFPQGARYQAWTKKEPVGVVAGIVPWNFPLMIGMWKVMPALAAGCSIVIKPSETTPLTLLRVAELATLAGIPDGVFNVVTGSAGAVGGELTSNPLVRKLSFTGSTEVGRVLMRQCAESIKKLSLELGGNRRLSSLTMPTSIKPSRGRWRRSSATPGKPASALTASIFIAPSTTNSAISSWPASPP